MKKDHVRLPKQLGAIAVTAALLFLVACSAPATPPPMETVVPTPTQWFPPTSTPTATPTPVRVTLSTFSGRPDPTWRLDDEHAEVLREILNSLEPTDTVFDATGLPSYAGFHVEAERGTITGEARYLDVYAGAVLLFDENLERLGQLEDPEYKVETFLFESAERRVEPAVYDQAFDRFRKLKTG